MLMQLVHYILGRYTDGADEKSGTLFDDDVNKLRKLTACIVGLNAYYQIHWCALRQNHEHWSSVRCLLLGE